MENVVVIFVTRVLQYYKDEEVGKIGGCELRRKGGGWGRKEQSLGVLKGRELWKRKK